MIYKIIIGKKEIQIDDEEKRFFTENQDKRFIELKSGEIINTAFVQGIIMDEDLSREENAKKLKLFPKDLMTKEKLEDLRKSYHQNNKLEIKEVSNILDSYKIIIK